MIGMGIGGLQALRTGDLKQGIMAGLGAYGGAGMAGMAGLGTSEVGANASQALESTAQSQAPGAQAIAEATHPNMSFAPLQQAPGAGAQAISAATHPNMSTALSGTPSFMDAVAASPMKAAQYGLAAAAPMMGTKQSEVPVIQGDTSMGPRYSFSPGVANPFPQASPTGVEQNYYPNQSYKTLSETDAKALYGYADGGDVQFPNGESVMFMAAGGLSDLGGYSDGGRLLKGPGDGVSDSIPAQIGGKQPARLADGEFVVPARIVSELGNGSTDAGARQLYAMMDRVQKARTKTTGKGKMAKNTNASSLLPA
jgi:hypothetical protein